MAKQRLVPLPEEDNAAVSFAEWLSSLGNATRGAMAGKFDSAGRSISDTILQGIDAIVPGDVFEKQSLPGDQTNFDELLGGMEPGVARSLTNVIGNTFTDPFAALQLHPAGRALLPKAGRNLLKLAEREPHLKEALYGLRKATGNVRKGPRVSEAMSVAAGKEAAVEEGWRAHVQDKLAPYDEGIRKTVFDTVQNVVEDGPKKYKVLNERHDKRARYMENDAQIRDALERVKEHPAYASLDPKLVESAVKDIYGISHGMFAQAGHHKAWDMPKTVMRNKNGKGELYAKQDFDEHLAKMKPILDQSGVTPDDYAKAHFEEVPFDHENMSIRDYLRRTINVDGEEGKAVSELARSKKTGAELVDYLNSNKVTSYERDALKAIAERIPGQGRLIRKQTLADELFPGKVTVGHRAPAGDFEGAASGTNAFKKAVAEDIATGKLTDEEADALRTLWEGVGDERSTAPIHKILDYANTRFKQAAVYGILIPKFAGLFRNRFGTAFQALGAEGVSNKAAWNQFRTAIPDTFSAIIHDGFKLNMPKGALAKQLGTMEEAMKIGGGRAEKAAAHLRSQGNHKLAQALELGVIDSGFVSAERMLADINKTKWTTLRDAPERMFQGTEQRARLSLFLDLLDEGGTNAKAAAAKAKDTLYDYSFSSKANRNLRKWVPFAQFTFQAIPREGGKLLRNPAALSAVSNLYGQDEENPLPEWMAKRAHLATGKNSALSGLGLPMEALTALPNLTGGNIRESIWDSINQMQPLVKTGLGFVSDRDPFTGGEFGGTQKLPFDTEQSGLGKAYRIAEGTGLLQGFTGPVQMAETLTKPGRDTASSAAQVFVGPTIREFDPVQAEVSLRERSLSQNPEAQKKSFTAYSAREGAGQDTIDMISELQAMKRDLQQAAKARKAKASEAGSVPATVR